MKNSSILTETGTGELEIVKFIIDKQSYAINVIKTEAIIRIEKEIISVPMTNKEFVGNMSYRGEVIPVIDLRQVIKGEGYKQYNQCQGLSCEFNQNKAIFLIDKVESIERISWADIKQPDRLSGNNLVVGNILLNDEIIQMLDFEKILDNSSPDSVYKNKEIKIEKKDRSSINIVFAEDSSLLRNVLENTLKIAGINNIKQFKNGQDALEYIEENVDNIDVVITDIEMPKLDGHRLTKLLKENKKTAHLPIIIFSSLITQSLRHKGESVGADYQLSKPEVEKILPIIDKELNL